MEILQHYYTSFINRESGSAGFQVKAVSPGISPDTQNMILRLIAYRIPASLDERAFETHPRALRYYHFNEREGLLISSRSNGSDPNGRPGNFFAHTLVVDPQLFTTVPPVLYWESEFWRKEDTETCTVLQTLSDLPGDPALDIDSMWTFLQEGKRREVFFKLMCAVVHGAGSRRRIIIVDSDEHVAFWIAAISCMLPPAYRPLLSFTTYHHDPYQSQFFITGTPPSHELRLASEDYQSYFILNMHENKISDVGASLYAELAHMYATSEQSDNEMLTFFSRYAYRFPTPTVIDEQLDSIALYAHIMKKDGNISFSTDQLQAISQVLPTFEQLKYYEAQDIKDLKYLNNFLHRFYQASDNHEAEQLRLRIVALLDRHKVPTDEIFKQDLATYTQRIFRTYASDTGIIALKGIERLLRDYGEEKFIDQVNQVDYLSTLSELVTQSQVVHLTRMWQSVGPYLLPNTVATQEIFAQSIYAWGHYAANTVKNKPYDAKSLSALFVALQNAIAPRGPAWFKLLVTDSSLHTLPVEPRYLSSFYCEFVSSLSLEQREPYRNVLCTVFNDLINSEFTYDLSKTNVETMLPAIRKWVIYVQRTHLHEPAALVAQGLATLRSYYQSKPERWGIVARQCLVDPQLSHSLGQWEARLLEDAFSALSLSQFDPKHLPLYRQYSHHEALPARSRTIINGFLAMYDRHLDPQLARELSQYAMSLSHEAYYIELSSFCDRFFTEQLSNDDHFQLLAAFFVWQHNDVFWQIYWEKVCVQPTEAVARLLAFWFTLRPTQLSQSYVTQGFLLALQHNLQQYQKMPDFQKTLTQIADYSWYAAIQDAILVRKNALLTMGQDLMKQVQKRLPNQKADDEAEEQEHRLQDEMRKLFEKGRIRDVHLSMLMNVYQTYTPAQFWEAYKERLIQLLLTSDAEHALEIFSFWFNESFSSFAHKPFIAQSFFIGLPQLFDLACKENEADMRKMARKLLTHVEQTQASYSWYALIQSFLPEQQTTEQRSRWFKR